MIIKAGLQTAPVTKSAGQELTNKELLDGSLFPVGTSEALGGGAQQSLT